VLELAAVLAGPAVGMFLAELGADVIKVENPRTGGDVTRGWLLPGEVPRAPGVSAYFSCVNWGKRSVAIDLSTPVGRDLVIRLARRADVLLASFRPGQAASLGLDADRLLAENAGLVVAEVTAYGDGDERPGYDALLQAGTGFMAINGTPGTGPLKMPVALIDLLAGHQLKEAVLLALLERARTGRGRRVSVSLQRAGLASLANQASGWLVAGREPRPLGSGHPSIVPYGEVVRCADARAIVLAVGTDRQFAALCEVLDAPELATDLRFATNADRVRNRTVLAEILAERIRLRNSEPLLDGLERRGVPAGPVLDVGEALAEDGAAPLLLRSGGWRGLRTAAVDEGVALAKALSPPPPLSRDARSVLTEDLGLEGEAIEALYAGGAVLPAEETDA
jgi:crotonobetainyl-CoA:carnitine CoA-transferase CaiB-like acyl-CoA transferase